MPEFTTYAESQQISGTSQRPSGRLAIRCIRPDLTDNRHRDEYEMRRLGVLLGYAVDKQLVVIDPYREGPYATVMLALARTHADAVIVPDLEHVDGIDHWIRERAHLITVVPHRVLERVAMAGGATGQQS